MSTKYDFNLLAAGISAIIGSEVVIAPSPGPGVKSTGASKADDEKKKSSGIPVISVQELFNLTYVPFPIQKVEPGEKFEIHVKTILGSSITVEVTDFFTIADIKALIELKEDIPARKQKLTFSGNTLNDEETLKSAGISAGMTVFLTVLLRGGVPSFQLPEDQLAPRFNCDFTKARDDRKRYMRGSHQYHRPYGWYRYGISVLGDPKYENDVWLGPRGSRQESVPGEWPVAYHGTSMESARKVIAEGYNRFDRQRYGRGIYTSPSIEMVGKVYAQSFTHDSKRWKIVLQNRVNPAEGHLIINTDNPSGAPYWISPRHDTTSGIYDVRPYGFLVHELPNPAPTSCNPS